MLVKNCVKCISYLIAMLFMIVCIANYSNNYISANKLSFENADVGLLLSVSVGLLVTTLAMVSSIAMIYRLQSSIVDLSDQIADVEDNVVDFSRTTQSILIKMVEKKVGSTETRCELTQKYKMD